jgi:hypothetical protein
MKNGACSHEVETTRIDRPRDDIALAELNARSTHGIDKREVEIHGDDLSVGSNVLSHPRRDRTVAATDFQHPGLAADSERFDMSPLHRIK